MSGTERIKRLSARADAHREYKQAGARPFYTTYYLDAYVAHLGDPPILREAQARAAAWASMPITVGPDERLVGELCHERHGSELVYFYYGRGTIIDEKRLEACRTAGLIPLEVEAKLDLVRQHSYSGWPRHLASEAQRLSQAAGAAWAQTWGGHMVLDYPLLLKSGWDGIAAWAEECAARRSPGHTDVAAFDEAMRTTLRAAAGLMLRYADLCEAETWRCADSARRQELSEMAERCAYLTHGPARDFRDAIQQVWFLHSLSGADSVGRFDQYLGAYYQRDVDAGCLTRHDALEWVIEFWLKVAQAGAIQNLTIGGQDEAGNDATNEVTYLALEATRLCKRPHPNLCLRLHAKSPQRIWREAVATIAGGTGTPALYNDAPAIAGLQHLGIPLQEARDYCPAGCSQTVVPFRCHFMNDAGCYNAAKVLDLALHNGYDTRLGAQVGPFTGTPTSLPSYEALEEAVYRQLAYFARMEAEVNNLNYRHFADHEGYALRALLTRDCVASGRDIWHGGARYNGIQLEIPGLTNMADSLAAIRELVYERRLISLPELIQVLDANWEGHPELRAAARQAPKFGNNDDRVDEIRARFTHFLYDELQRQPAEGGGVYIPGEVIFVYHEGGGHQTGATPDGRLAGTILADSAGAAQGQDKGGPTALMRSVSKLPHDLGTTSIVLNFKLVAGLFREEGMVDRLVALFQSYFDMGGLQIQVNVVDHDELVAAQAQPEAYADLVVRVGGFSAYFVTLSRELQDDIISRTAH